MTVAQINYSSNRIFFPISVLVFVGFSLFTVFSCTPQKENPLLSCADSLMTERPDSALAILESIPSPQKLSRANRALYALLLTQAQHKNYVPIESDSLIKTAVDYYGNKKSLRAAQAHYYWGAAYFDMGRTHFAVEEYLKAIQLMPYKDDFLAMIYENLAECYKDDNLYDVAMEAYRKAYHIRQDDRNKIFSLRGIAHIFLLQDQLDSTLFYYQKAFDAAEKTQIPGWIAAVYHDLATVYEQKKDYNQANLYISKAISMMNPEEAGSMNRFKGQIMLITNNLDSAQYYFNKSKNCHDIYGEVVRYSNLYKIEKRKKNWEAAVENADAYMILYDSIQGLSESRELARLMDNHQLEEHKRELSQKAKLLAAGLTAFSVLLIIAIGFYFLWNDRRRKKRYISLQQELLQKRWDIMLLKEERTFSRKEDTDSRLTELRGQQLELCISMFQATDCYKKLQSMEKASPKQLLSMAPALRPEINDAIHKIFVDIMTNLKESCPALTNDDLFYCILTLLNCSKLVIMELMNATSDAIKTRKYRIKNKMDTELFQSVFSAENQ